MLNKIGVNACRKLLKSFLIALRTFSAIICFKFVGCLGIILNTAGEHVKNTQIQAKWMGDDELPAQDVTKIG